MTIKQQGGVFGRNPTFNDVEANNVKASVVDATSIDTSDIDITSTSANPFSFVSTNASGAYATFNNGTQTSLFAGFGSTLMSGATVNDAVLRYDSNDNLHIARGSAKVATFNSSGSLEIANGSLVISTAGGGIDFSATSGTGTSELFDDYEEGTWTPALTFDSGLSGSFTYTTQVGTYTKIGRLVTARLNLVWTGIPSAGSIMTINLPFTAASATSVYGYVANQGGITNDGFYAITGGDGLTIASYTSTQAAVSTVKSGAAFADPLKQASLTSASGRLRAVISFEV
jgi:hypothetical protein